ncbi:MAG: DUF4286 family protein [Saprospiraceae bacterium]|nr:DUF4286 family protein [Saprospiraceae bacterium]
MPVVYNVTIIIDHSVHDEWVDWMKNEHIPEVMATGKFTSWKMLRIIEDHNPDGLTYAIQYQAPDMEAYLTYQNECAPALAGCPKQVWRPVWSFSHLYGGN